MDGPAAAVPTGPDRPAPALQRQAGGVLYCPARADAPSAEAISAAADKSLLTALLETARRHGASIAVEDGDRRSLSYKDFVRAVAALSRVIRRRTTGDVVAVMLPSSVAGAVTFFAVLAAGRTPAMLNFTAGPKALLAACRLADVRSVLTADRFLSLARLEPLAADLRAEVEVLALEALRGTVSAVDKAFAAAAAPLRLLPAAAADDSAAILFTSGSEGDPKAVALSHRNILANVQQVIADVPLGRMRTLFNPLPVFHSYGLSVGMILPLVLGLKVVLHPSPLRAREVAQRIAETRANVLLATDTFLRQYLRVGDPGSLSSLEFAVCGAERVRPETRELARSRFDFAVLEGYGVTETSPVLSVNHPDDIRDGTVGRIFPGVEMRLEPVEGLADGHRLWVRGPNVMQGYRLPGGTLVAPPGGWHDTGDVVALIDGHLAIRGRLKRFAKIGGEMTSLATVEAIAGALWPETLHSAAALPDGRKGEKIVLLSESADPDPTQFLARLRAEGVPERFLPAQFICVDSIPLLGSGKVDNPAVARLAADLLAARPGAECPGTPGSPSKPPTA